MLRANGLRLDGMAEDDAMRVVGVLVATGRAVPVECWVEELVEERARAALEAII